MSEEIPFEKEEDEAALSVWEEIHAEEMKRVKDGEQPKRSVAVILKEK